MDRLVSKQQIEDTLKHLRSEALSNYEECEIPRQCPNGIPDCGCDHCAAADAGWKIGEKQLVRKETDTVDTLWDPSKGYLGPTGCRLQRQFRPLGCIVYFCNGRIE